MKRKKVMSLVLSVMLLLGMMPVQQIHASVMETELWSDDFEGASDGAELYECDGWYAANSYIPTGESNNNVYTTKSEGSNTVASFVKGPNDGQSRLWAAHEIAAPTGTEKITLQFKLRSNSGSGAFEIGFANGTQWPSNGNLRIVLDSNTILWRPGLGGSWTSEARLGTTGSWNDIEVIVEPQKDQNGTVRGMISVKVNGQARGGDWMNSTGLGAAYTPTAVGFGWVRTQSVGADLDIDDISCTVGYSVPFALAEQGELEQIEPSEPLRLNFTGAIDAASLSSATVTLADPDIFVTKTAVAADDPNALLVTFNRSLNFSTRYALSVSGVSESGGGTMEAATIHFVTRGRRTHLSSPRFYKQYGEATQQAVSTFEADTLTAVLEYQNENEPFSAVAIAAVTDGDRVVRVTCKSAEIGTSGQVELPVDTTGGTELTVYLWKNLQACEPVSQAVTLHASGINAPSFRQAATVNAVKATMLYDSYQLSVNCEADSGETGLLLLKPNVTPENVTAENINEAVAAVAQIDVAKTYTHTYSSTMVAEGQYTYTLLAGGKTTPVQLYSTTVLKAALTAVASADSGELKALLAGEKAIMGTVLLNDVLQLDLTVYNALQNQQSALDAVAKKTYASIEACKTAVNAAVAAQAETEKQQAVLLTNENAADWSELEALLREGNTQGLISLDFDGDYQKLSNANKVLLYKHLAEDEVFNSLEEVSEAFAEWVKALSTTTSTTRPSGGGGGGGGSSSKGGTTLSFSTSPSTNQNNAATNNTPTNNTPTTTFEDCESVSWAQEVIEALAEQNIINGTGDGRFEPEKTVTREEFLKMLMQALKLNSGDATTTQFEDVPQNAWYAPYVAAAASIGLVSGVTETSFGVGNDISRADMAVLCARALAMNGITLSQQETESFADYDSIASYAAESVSLLQRAGLMSGMDDNCFMPQASANRAMAAKLIYNMLQTIKGE